MGSRAAASALALLALGAITLACGAVRQPARSPLAEPALTSTVAPSAALPVVTSTPLPRGDAAPTPAELEPATARAAALMAEWLAVPPRDLRVVASEAVVWPSACLGLALPGQTCADARTPGFRVLLRDGLGGLHSVHTAVDGGDARWRGEATARGVLAALDRGTQRATVAAEGGAPLVLRLAPGTRLDPGVRAGTVVAVGYDPSGSASAPPVAAWLVPAP